MLLHRQHNKFTALAVNIHFKKVGLDYLKPFNPIGSLI